MKSYSNFFQMPLNKGDLKDFIEPERLKNNGISSVSQLDSRFSRKFFQKIRKSIIFIVLYVRTVRIFKFNLDKSKVLSTFASWLRK
jgi:hypothetical protein